MEKLKNLIKSDTPTSENVASGATGKISGQGSHFPGKEETSITGTGTTAPGNTVQSKGPEDVSAVPAGSTAAATTAGPEQSGSSHVNAVPAASDQYSTAQTTAGPTEYSVGSADFPKTETSTDGTGTAAVGQTATYSSSYVGRGDPTSSVVDPQSSDPLTYKKPETGTHSSEAGVGAGAATAAASLAFDKAEERKKEDMSGYENPYRAVTLDPRVDGLPKSSADTPATGVGAGAASLGASQAFSKPQEPAAAPSTLTTSVDPADRSAEYGQSTTEKGLPAPTTTTSARSTETPADNETSVVGKVLGAVGLGSLAGYAGAKATSEKDTEAVAETPEQPTTTTGIESYTAPTEQGPPTSHHRKESIPTTAYPSGSFDSPRAINQPIGGAGSPVVHGDRESHAARDVGVGAAAGGAAVGAAAVGAHEYEQSKAVREGISGEPQSSAPVLKEPADTSAPTGINPSQYTESQQLRHNIVSDPPTTATASGTETAPKQAVEDHTTRDTAIGAGAGAAVVGAGTVGAHEYSKREAEKAEAEAAKEQAAREKEIARQKAAEEKELEKEHKAAEKTAAKEEKQHQKELEKEEKKHQKEVEKAEKKHQKEVEKAEKEEEHRRESAEAAALKEQRAREKEAARLDKQRAEEEEERRNREEKERLAGAVGVGGATAATAEEKEREPEVEKEKKPSLFKRIFKRRKNKDTGEDEDYESDEEDKSHTGTAAAAGGAAVVGGGGAAAYAAEHEKSTHPVTQPTSTTVPSTTEATGTTTQQPAGAVTGVPYDATREPQVAHSTGVAHSKEIAPATVESTGTSTQQPTEAITGLPYDASKDPQAAARLSEHGYGAGIESAEPTAQGSSTEATGEYPVKTDFTLGEVQDNEGNPVQPEEPHDMKLGERLKATFHMGGLDS